MNRSTDTTLRGPAPSLHSPGLLAEMAVWAEPQAAAETQVTWPIQWTAFADLVAATSAGGAVRSWARSRRLTLDQAVVAVTRWTRGEPASEAERWEVSCYDGLAAARPLDWTDASERPEPVLGDVPAPARGPSLTRKLVDLAVWVLTMGRGHG